MPRAFHVDRSAGLKAGDELGLIKPLPMSNGQPSLLAMAHVDAAFPQGLSRFGCEYLIERVFLMDVKDYNQVTDFVFELVRRASFPERPSRYSTIFGSATLEEAQRFRADHCGGAGTIWEIETDGEPFSADYEHLSWGGSALDIWMRAERYWRGEPSESPAWELLLPASVRIVAEA